MSHIKDFENKFKYTSFPVKRMLTYMLFFVVFINILFAFIQWYLHFTIALVCLGLVYTFLANKNKNAAQPNSSYSMEDDFKKMLSKNGPFRCSREGIIKQHLKNNPFIPWTSLNKIEVHYNKAPKHPLGFMLYFDKDKVCYIDEETEGWIHFLLKLQVGVNGFDSRWHQYTIPPNQIRTIYRRA